MCLIIGRDLTYALCSLCHHLPILGQARTSIDLWCNKADTCTQNYHTQSLSEKCRVSLSWYRKTTMACLLNAVKQNVCFLGNYRIHQFSLWHDEGKVWPLLVLSLPKPCVDHGDFIDKLCWEWCIATINRHIERTGIFKEKEWADCFQSAQYESVYPAVTNPT